MKRVFNRAHRLDKIEISKIRLLSARVRELRAQGKEIDMFTMGMPDFPTPRYIIDACTDAMNKGLTTYEDYEGPKVLREEICKKLAKENDLYYTPEEIFVTVGAAQAVYLIMASYLDPGDEIIIPDPVYNIYEMNPYTCEATVKKYKLQEKNNFQIDIDELSKLITEKTKLIAIVSPSNPIGAVQTRDTLEKVAELIRDKNIMIVSDEIYERLTYDNVKVTSPASLPGMKDKVFVINGFSKAFSMTGWRIGYIACPSWAIADMYAFAGLQTSGGTSFAQHAAAVALRDEYKYNCIETMRSAFEERRNYFVEQFSTMEHFSCLKPQGAFYIFLNITKTGMTSAQFVDWMVERYGVAVVNGAIFGEEGEGYVRLSYAASMESIKSACKKFRQADQDLSAMGI